MISVIVPAYNEKGYLVNCIKSLQESMKRCPCDVEVIVVDDVKGIGKARNIGASKALGDVLVFVDADCTVSPNFLNEVHEKSLNEDNVGGGVKYVKFDRYSPGRIAFMFLMAVWLYWHQVSFGSFWVRKLFFGGFIENNDPKIDLEFALRLKRIAKLNRKNFRSIKQSPMTWSTRSFDKYGDWFWVRKYKLYQAG